MNTKLAAAALALIAATATTGVMAKDHGDDVWGRFDNASQYTVMTRGRAEVLADLEIWRRSGMAELANRDQPETYSEQYRQAFARYSAMRASPEFAQRVQEIAHERGEVSTVAQPSSAGIAR